MLLFRYSLLVLLIATQSFRSACAEVRPILEITAQGFSMNAPQETRLSAFERLRVRIEASEGIETLSVKERSYEVDLASTLDKSNYRLFGLDKRVMHQRDVTLNFQPYLADKIDHVGRYVFVIQVTDSTGRMAQDKLVVIVKAPDETRNRPELAPLKGGSFVLRRIGSRPVQGDPEFGLVWKTIDATNVTIRLAGRAMETSIIGNPSIADYERLKNHRDLLLAFRSMQKDGPLTRAQLETANNAAAGHVLAVETKNKYYLLKINSSTTSTSPRVGTTVTLKGDYKYANK